MSERTKDQYVQRKSGNSGWWDSPLAAKLFAVLTKALKAQDQKNLKIFKTKEAWDN